MQPPALTELGRYQLVEQLGRGGMAEVYKAKLAGALGINRLVAVKRMLPEARRNAEYVELFIREARVCSRMMHPNLIQIFELGQTESELFLAMELVEGPDLRKVLTANQQLGRTLPLEFAICIANGVLRGLDAAHRLTDDEGKPLGVVHRDLSPANVLLSYEGAIKVADFGVAHSGENQPIAADSGKIKGKLQYMAPEQIVGVALDPRVDVFAAAAVVYEMVSGRELYPWTDTADVVQRVAKAKFVPVEKVAPNIEPQLAVAIGKGLAADPAQRYSSCDAFAGELARLVQQGRIPAAPESELAMYLQVLTPKQPFRAELVYTPTPTPDPGGSSPAIPAIKLGDDRRGSTPGLSTRPGSGGTPAKPAPAMKPVSAGSAPPRPLVAPPPGAFSPGSRPPSRNTPGLAHEPSSDRPASGGMTTSARSNAARPPSNPALVRPVPAPVPIPGGSSPGIKAQIFAPSPSSSSASLRAQVATPSAPPTSSVQRGPPPPAPAPAVPAPPPPVAPAPTPPAAKKRPTTSEQIDALLVSYLAGDAIPPAPAPPAAPGKPKKDR